MDEKPVLSSTQEVQEVPEREENVQWTFLAKDKKAHRPSTAKQQIELKDTPARQLAPRAKCPPDILYSLGPVPGKG